jgi:hypothetical protein
MELKKKGHAFTSLPSTVCQKMFHRKLRGHRYRWEDNIKIDI